MTNPQSSSLALPCVVQVGFAGSRRLFENPLADPVAERQWHDRVMQHVVKSIDELPRTLQLPSQHFLCGISQIAWGADTIFTRVCCKQAIPQRIFLPQSTSDYLAATGSSGTPDFTPAQRNEAETLLASEHIIQHRIVSQSSDRTDRFREAIAEILRVSDVVICLLRDASQGKAGGTQEFLQRALAEGTPVLQIRVAVEDGQPVCRNEWHIPLGYASKRPAIPEPLDRLALPPSNEKIPSSEQYCGPLKDLVSTQAKRQQRFFRYAVALIILAHIIATLFATAALALHGHAVNSSAVSPEEKSHAVPLTVRVIPWVLGIELVFLLVGFLAHRILHHSRAARIWANARVVAELARSIRAIHPRHVYLEHLFRLSLPPRFRALLRTLSVLHLRSTYRSRNDPWPPHRDKYIRERIDHQITFYTSRLAEDVFRQKFCQGVFTSFSVLAMAATLIKLGLLVVEAKSGVEVATWPQLLGTSAVVFPLLAVAGLSWSAALDCEARIETFGDTLAFLKEQKEVLPHANTAAEFDRLMLQTETVLLGESANWFSRRANTGVT